LMKEDKGVPKRETASTRAGKEQETPVKRGQKERPRIEIEGDQERSQKKKKGFLGFGPKSATDVNKNHQSRTRKKRESEKERKISTPPREEESQNLQSATTGRKIFTENKE